MPHIAPRTYHDARAPHTGLWYDRGVSMQAVLAPREGRVLAHLVALLVWRDLTGHYRRSALGALWAVLRPLVTVLLFVVVFGRVLRVDTGAIPYAAFALTGLVAWQAFADAISRSATSLIDNRALLQRTPVARVVFPLAAVLLAGVYALASYGALFVVLAVMGVPLGAPALCAPIFFMLTLLIALGVGLALAALSVYVRDLVHALPIGLQLLLFASPVAYPLDAVPEALRPFYLANPLSRLVEAHRDVLLRGTLPSSADVAYLAGVALLTLACGYGLFARLDRRMLDVL